MRAASETLRHHMTLEWHWTQKQNLSQHSSCLACSSHAVREFDECQEFSVDDYVTRENESGSDDITDFNIFISYRTIL